MLPSSLYMVNEFDKASADQAEAVQQARNDQRRQMDDARRHLIEQVNARIATEAPEYLRPVVTTVPDEPAGGPR